MTTEHDLDAQLLAARGVQDTDLPALPEAFLDYLRTSDIQQPYNDATPVRFLAPVQADTPASVLAARQLVADAQQRRRGALTAGRRWSGRRTVVRVSAAVLAIAAAWTTAVTVAPSDPAQAPDSVTASPSAETPTTPEGAVVVDGMTLVAAERVTFPMSLDPVPEGLTPSFTRSGGPTPFGEAPVTWSANYRSADGAGFGFWLTPQDLREDWAVEHEKPQDSYGNYDIVETTTVTVTGIEADLVRGNYEQPNCTYAPSTPVQTETPAEVCTSSFADLTWQRPDGQWVFLRGEDSYASTAAVVAVAESMVDRPQPVDLQIGLAPVGWSLSSYEENAMSFVDGVDPQRRLAVGLLERWRGETVENAFEGMYDGPGQELTVNGRPAKLILVDSGGFNEWVLVGEAAGGALFYLQAPETFTHEQMVELAGQVTYTP